MCVLSVISSLEFLGGVKAKCCREPKQPGQQRLRKWRVTERMRLRDVEEERA